MWTLAVLALGARPLKAGVKARLGQDGLYNLDWYLESFLDLAEDHVAAQAQGKRFAVLWGLRGCPACRRMHEVHLADPTIAGYIRENFDVLHLNILGAREVTDWGGDKLGEKAFAQRYGVVTTPTWQFFPEQPEGVSKLTPAAREVARLDTLPDPPAFLVMFQYVRQKGYEQRNFEAWRKARSRG